MVAAAAVAAALTGLAGSARADEPALPYTGDLDGDYLLLGPLGGAVQIEGAWDGAFGAQGAWLRVRERRPVSAAGVVVGGARYSRRDGGRVWVEGVLGTRSLLPFHRLAGVSAGPVVELLDTEHARLGVGGTVWLFSGIVPYVRAGWLDEAGAFVEAGIAVELPVVRWP